MMSGIQSLLAIGAVWLFALVSINFNSAVVHNISIEVENKAYLDAFSLADDMIEEIKEKVFDENTTMEDSILVVALSSLTSKDSLTFEPDTSAYGGWEKWPNFDDIDDYNTYKDSVELPYVEKFIRTVKVYYANPNNFDDLNPGLKSFYKRVVVTVTSKYLRTPVELSFVFSLHSKLR